MSTTNASPRIEVRTVAQLPPPSMFLNYKQDQTRNVGRWYGPTLLDEQLTLVSCEHVESTGMFRVGFVPGMYTVEIDEQEGSADGRG